MAVSTAASAVSANELLLAASEQVEYQEPGWFAVVLIGILAITGSVFVLVSARAMFLAPDALSQLNMTGPALGVGIPLLICANLVFHFATEGFVLGYLIRACVAITAFLVISSVGSFFMGRALHATHWDHTVPLSGGTRPPDAK
ncbi:Na+/H+ antiporter subunit G [Corynebacterium urealyticum]|uniref:Na+/H+ antiporter subunit G n=1 Tax=Corynebacterium urealyticum TaxID=43771 RepID=A0A2W5D365_9CORY|nr:Na+/H+ antiporter subunit G [Corynebacterium urealyticum]AGE37396.1 Na+/H+ antiporter subunit [Corynebacterium urealyticum DSM 7111]PZP01736.1 MAG: Na+/H+ antiporter subunit G [Corynebacterium urealyticum]QQB07229.1 Na+/H+ antiporter subunit G [Corynebacterium urealyticum]QQE51223.1 Na+/H+ antiporter subunit G [Corynebacterium urealyticum]